ncbi:hypothetical protein PRO82_001682 [Candidatus Protochlamydia amoebophila]|nr:hypothetical protein [Candidatus Protochlamydia amoebophila]
MSTSRFVYLKKNLFIPLFAYLLDKKSRNNTNCFY